MTAQEIKKEYQRTKKAYEKRTGEKYTWVMNVKQQRLGTATVLVAIAWDYEDQMRRAEKSLAGFEKMWEERMADYSNRAKEEAWKNEHTPGWYFGGNNTFWQDVINNAEKLAEDKKQELTRSQGLLEEAKKNLDEKGDFGATLKATISEAEAMIASPEVQEFLKTVEGQAFVEIKEQGCGEHILHHAEVHIRFQYEPTDN